LWDVSQLPCAEHNSEIALTIHLYPSNINRASDRLQAAKKGKFCGIFKGNFVAKKIFYFANYAIFLKLI